MSGSRLSRGVVGLAASAITAVYAAGYVHTSAADSALAAGSNATTPTNTAPSSDRPTASLASSTAAAPSRPTLKDGTYTGVGTSRRGDVHVSLSIQGGRITSVNITGSTTQYPTRFIANLPGEVISRQSVQVDVVSGATDSSLAFRGAVQQALQRAQV